MIAPPGILIVTGVLWWLNGNGDLADYAAMVQLGVLVYAAIGVAVERGIFMTLWAFEKTFERWARYREEGRAKGREEGREEQRAEFLEILKTELAAGKTIEDLAKDFGVEPPSRNGDVEDGGRA